MKLSNLDLFQKIDDEKRMATTYGGILSLLSIISVIVLCSLEIKSFLNPPERQHISINSIRPTGSDGRTITMDDQPHVEMYFDITLPSLPCYLVQFDVIDFISQLPLPVNQSKTKFIRLSNDGKEIDRFNYEFLASDVQKEPGPCYVDNVSQCFSCKDVLQRYKGLGYKLPLLSTIKQCQNASKSFEKMRNEGCRVKSYFSTIRIAGTFLIAAGVPWFDQGWYTHSVDPFGINYSDINLTHHINKFHLNGKEGKMALDDFHNIQDEKNIYRVSYTLNILGDNYSASRYSIYNPDLEPEIIFKYDFSPIIATTYLDKQPVLSLATNLLSVLGCIIGIFMMIDSIIYSIGNRSDEQYLEY